MSTKVLAIGVGAQGLNLIYNTLEEARKDFVGKPEFERTMTFSSLQKAIEKGSVVYNRGDRKAYCLDILVEEDK